MPCFWPPQAQYISRPRHLQWHAGHFVLRFEARSITSLKTQLNHTAYLVDWWCYETGAAMPRTAESPYNGPPEAYKKHIGFFWPLGCGSQDVTTVTLLKFPLPLIFPWPVVKIGILNCIMVYLKWFGGLCLWFHHTHLASGFASRYRLRPCIKRLQEEKKVWQCSKTSQPWMISW